MLTYGVLRFGLPVAIAPLAVRAWQANAWPTPREWIAALAGALLAGVLFGVVRLDGLERMPELGPKRCGECGDVLPAHTDWCPAGQSSRASA